MNATKKYYNSLSDYYIGLFGEKVYKLALTASTTCPNRDGKIGNNGCIFCSTEGSGDFASNGALSVQKQILEAKQLIKNKKTNKYIAYFQSYTNTYGDLSQLNTIFNAAVFHPEISGLSIATRPDCLEAEVLELLSSLNFKKKLWVELGLQTMHQTTADFIRRGYTLDVFEAAVNDLTNLNIDVVVHLIIGLPGESRKMLLETIEYLSNLPVSGVKLQLLHVLKNTDLEKYYSLHPEFLLSLEEYCELVVDCVERLSPSIVIHRLTGDGPKNLLVAPLWSTNKKIVLNTINKKFSERNTYQGKLWNVCP